MTRTVRLVVDAEIHHGVTTDLPALATWSGQVEEVFRPAVESEDRVLVVATANGRFPIGHVLIDLKGIISHLLVLGGFRDQGLGSALMDEAERLLKGAGAEHASLVVEKANDGAIRLYERRGYRSIGETVATWSEPEPDPTMRPVPHPSWVMRKEL